MEPSQALEGAQRTARDASRGGATALALGARLADTAPIMRGEGNHVLADGSDESLMLAFKAGDLHAFDALYARHRGGLFRYFVRQVGKGEIADELFQDVWMNLIRAKARYEPAAKFSTYLYRLAHNRLIDHYRSQNHVVWLSFEESSDGDNSMDPPAAANDEPERRAVGKQIGTRVMEAVARLPAVQREAFLMHEESDMTVEAIAEATGVPFETAKSRLRYAYRKLREELGDLL